MIKSSDCNLFIRSRQMNVEHILQRRLMHTTVIAELDELLDETPVRHYSYKKTFEQGRYDPFVVLHTSGSTGLPKPILLKMGTTCTIDAERLMPSIEGRDVDVKVWQQAKRVYSAMPLFHVRPDTLILPGVHVRFYPRLEQILFHTVSLTLK